MHQYIKSALPFLLLLALLAWAIWQAVEIKQLAKDIQSIDTEINALADEQAELSRQIEAQQNSAIISPPPLPPEADDVFIPDPDIPLSAELQEHTFEVADDYGIPYEILLAIMEHESGYKTDAVGYNHNGTYDSGLCQINSVNHDWLLNDYGLDVMIPADNIKAAAVILSLFLDKYPMEQALAAYAVGESDMLEGNGYWFAEDILERVEDAV